MKSITVMVPLTMKHSLLKTLLLAAALVGAASAFAATKPGSWAELKAYHDVMSSTFHPAEEGKLDPIKTRSGELAKAAAAWVTSKPPAEFNQPAIIASLKLLHQESVALDKLIAAKKSTDAEITAALTKLHDRFHEVVGACADAGKDAKH